MIEYAAAFVRGGKKDLAISSIPPSPIRAEVQTRVDRHNAGILDSTVRVGKYVVAEREVGKWRISEAT